MKLFKRSPLRKDKYIRVSTAMGVVLTGGCGECKMQRSEHCKGCRTQTILDLLDDVANTEGVEIPQRHGRLIDADALRRQWIEVESENGGEMRLDELTLHDIITEGCVFDLDNAPTIIEAEGSGKDG